MVEKANADNDSKKANGGQNNVAPTHLRTALIGGGIAIVGLLLASVFWPNLSERTKFFTGNLLNLVIAVAVIVQVLINRKQWDAMRDTLKEMSTARELQNRAWVGVKSVNYKVTPSGVEIVAIFVNSGNSPTVVTLEYMGTIRQSPPPDDFEYPRIEKKGSRLTLFPNAEYVATLHLLSGFPFIDPQRPDDAYYIFGDLRYSDIFGHSHTTKFCYEDVRFKGMAAFGASATHNTFD